MDSFHKLAVVAKETRYESDGDLTFSDSPLQRSRATIPTFCGGSGAAASPSSPLRSISTGEHELPIHMAVAPGGKRIPLLKSMLTTACEMDCHYCTFRAGKDFRRVHFHAQELASIFMQIYRTGEVQGLFLSTGILAGGANTQNRILDTAHILRKKFDYRGYLHIKLMPGSEKDQVLHAMQLGDRVSINLEAPTAERLRKLAPQKRFKEQLLTPFRWIDEIRSATSPRGTWNGRWPSSTTQFVVGAAGESDLELLRAVQFLARTAGFARAYFEAFTPVPDTPLENHPPTDTLRQHRLYQASFLLRDYGFDLEDLPINSQGNLPLERDPKQAYAQAKLACTPIEVNVAHREELLKVPGIGLKGAEEIIKARKLVRLRELNQVKKLGILAERASPYISLDGKRPEIQYSMF